MRHQLKAQILTFFPVLDFWSFESREGWWFHSSLWVLATSVGNLDWILNSLVWPAVSQAIVYFWGVSHSLACCLERNVGRIERRWEWRREGERRKKEKGRRQGSIFMYICCYKISRKFLYTYVVVNCQGMFNIKSDECILKTCL